MYINNYIECNLVCRKHIQCRIYYTHMEPISIDIHWCINWCIYDVYIYLKSTVYNLLGL